MQDPGLLRLADGTFVEITGDVSKVCFRCHSAIYREFVAGAHGAGRPKCSSAGCHDPHTPGYMYADALLPFVGSGFSMRVGSEMATFTPLAGPPAEPPIQNPQWLVNLTLLGLVVAGGLTGTLVRGRSRR